MARREGAPPPRARKPLAATSPVEDNAGALPPEADMQEALLPQPPKRPPGRPRRAREVAASHNVRLDAQTQADLVRLASRDRRSIQSIILEGIRDVVQKLDADDAL